MSSSEFETSFQSQRAENVSFSGSDSATFDNALQFLAINGRSLPHSILMLIPEAWQNHATMDPDLKAFKARGGKLLLYHGWADPGPAPENTINYYDAVSSTLGGKQDDWMRLFLMPGVGHCGGGVGPDQADFIGALDRWRDAGKAPDRIDASKVTNGAVEMTRPLCAYPQVAVYSGKGSTSDAANFSCKNP